MENLLMELGEDQGRFWGWKTGGWGRLPVLLASLTPRPQAFPMGCPQNVNKAKA